MKGTSEMAVADEVGERDNGGPAYPTKGGMIFYFPEHAEGQMRDIADRVTATAEGMTLRDWFAGQALAAYLSRPDADESTYAKTASYAYDAADAMLAARSK